MPISLADKLLNEAYEIATISVIALTGGEATLWPDHLTYTVSRAAELGFIVRLVTNAWWAKTYEKARSFLERLARLGLREL